MEYNYPDSNNKIYFNPSLVRMITKTRVSYSPKIAYNITLTGGELEEKENKGLYEILEKRLTHEQGFMKLLSVDRKEDYELFLEILISIKHISGIHLTDSNEGDFNKMLVLYLENVVKPVYFYFYDIGSAMGLYYQIRGMLNYNINEITNQVKKMTIVEETPKIFKLNIK